MTYREGAEQVDGGEGGQVLEAEVGHPQIDEAQVGRLDYFQGRQVSDRCGRAQCEQYVRLCGPGLRRSSVIDLGGGSTWCMVLGWS